VLSFLGAVAGARLVEEAVCRRSTDGSAWWAEVALSWQETADYVWAAGGTPFLRTGGRWLAVPIAQSAPAGRRQETLDPGAWTSVELADLVAGIVLRPAPLPVVETVSAVLPGPLARWVLGRALAVGLQAAVIPAQRRPLQGNSPETGVLLVRLRAARGTIPGSLLHAATRLPGGIVGYPAGSTGGNLLIDVRHRAPMREAQLAAMIPEGETWVLGPPDVGHWRLRLVGQEIDGATLLQAPALPALTPPLGDSAALPAPVPVQLVARPGGTGRVDAVLVDNDDLARLRAYLPGRPAAEVAFLLPGQGHHLLTAPGGLPGVVPFGIPLTRIGPGGLYVEVGHDFYPPLPDGARQQAFGLEGSRAVAVVQGGAYQFDPRRLVPAWSLWLGAAPEVRNGLSPDGEALLMCISEKIRREEAAQIAPERPAPRQPDPSKRPRLLAEAQRLELAGKLVEAAELLEGAGELVRAARLYEEAASQMR
jgi:hypothetical protein